MGPGDGTMLKRFQNIKWQTLLIYVLISLAYPVVKALVSSGNRLQIFTDILTIFSMVLIIVGIFYRLVLKGDFDVTGFVFKRGAQKDMNQSFETYEKNKREEREAAFNYPLFLGILYFVVSIVIAYGFL